jgi:hypothetical protein
VGDGLGLFVRLLDMAFKQLAGRVPTVLRVDAVATDGAAGFWDFPLPWSLRDADLSPELLVEGSVLLLPPWGRGIGQKFAPHEDTLLACAPAGHDSLLAALLPRQILTSASARRVREALAVHWQPTLLLEAQSVFPGFFPSIGCVGMFLRARQEGDVSPLRFFRVPVHPDEEEVESDFRRLLTRNGGRGRFGYVLNDVPPPGESLGFERHDPDVLARRADLSDFGAAVTLDEMFDLQGRTFHSVRDKDLLCDADAPGVVRVLFGRDLRRDGTIALPDEDARWVAIPFDKQLQVGDILLPEIFRATDRGGLVAVEVTELDLPAAASERVIVLRAKKPLTAPQRLMTLQFLRSPLARTLVTASLGTSIHLHRRALKELHLPQPDDALSLALNDLTDAAQRFEAWRADAEALLQSVFLDDSAKAARARIVWSGRILRLRSDAASLLDDESYTVRTRFPYPIAYRWRGVEATVSAGATPEAYEAVLETAEVLLCYAAHLALAFAREENIELGCSKNIRARLADGKRGPGFGDWVAVLEEVRDSRACRDIPDTQPLNELRSLLADSQTDSARRRLSDRRNDQAHLRRVDSADLPHALDTVLADLMTLVRSASVLSDLPLVHLTSVQWDSLQERATVGYRELTGDQPVVPTRTMEYQAYGLELGSLYVMDSQRQLHLLRPFLTGRDCPTCRNWSTFHIDRAPPGTVMLKSLEHGHTLDDASLAQPFRHVGLL